MAVRGSALGASVGASVWSPGPGAGRAQSPTTQQMYGPGTSGIMGRLSGWAGTPVPHLLALVFAEVFALGALRYGFRNHHGG